MKTIQKMLWVFLFANAFGSNLFGQDAVTKANYKIYQGVQTLENVNGAAETAKKAGATFKSLFGSKKNKETSQQGVASAQPAVVNQQANSAINTITPPPSDQTTTLISINGVDLSKLMELQRELKKCTIVKECKPSLQSKGISSLSVSHTGSTTDLVEMVISKIQNQYSVNSFGDGAISLTLLK